MFVYKVQRNEKYKGWKVNLCVYVHARLILDWMFFAKRGMDIMRFE